MSALLPSARGGRGTFINNKSVEIATKRSAPAEILCEMRKNAYRNRKYFATMLNTAVKCGKLMSYVRDELESDVSLKFRWPCNKLFNT